jgi:hypothetical protein
MSETLDFIDRSALTDFNPADLEIKLELQRSPPTRAPNP